MATTSALGGWRFGLHPEAVGSSIGSIARRSLPVGDAWRVELQPSGAAGEVHLQYLIATGSGGWALWTTCRPEAVERRDASIAEIVPPEESAAEA